eukprot:EC849873.1.p3 GENE.EC849873.1~~EC849873.1.p3  ORF type:complete len:92 (-),score=3.46 EC849873.1:106-381(-)
MDPHECTTGDTRQKRGAFPDTWAPSPTNPIPGRRSVNKRRDLLPGFVRTSPRSFVLPPFWTAGLEAAFPNNTKRTTSLLHCLTRILAPGHR